jgi:hypothetical protein
MADHDRKRRLRLLYPPPWGYGPPDNESPVSAAGSDTSVTLPASATLVGSATDPDVGDVLTSLWSKVSGPGTVTFGDATDPTTTASFSVDGTYVLRLTVTDQDEATSSDDVTITVEPVPTLMSAILATSPTYYWPLDETSGTVANDLGSAGIDMTYPGTAILGQTGIDASDPSRTCVRFSANGRAVTPGAINLNGTQNITMMAVLKMINTDANERTIMGHEGGSWEGDCWQLRQSYDGLVGMAGGTSGGHSGPGVWSSFTNGGKRIVGMRRTSTLLTMFRDGVAFDGPWGVSSSLASNGPIAIGGRGNQNDRFINAYIQHCAIWKDVALSDAQMAAFADLAL